MRSDNKPTVMVVGTFHMRETPDLQRVDVSGVLTEERQAELRKVIDRIKAFKPTKVAVEMEKERQSLLDDNYKAFVEGRFNLEVNEIHQLGFRLANERGIEKIHAVDWMKNIGNRGVGEVLEWAEKQQPDLYEYISDEYLSNTRLNLQNHTIDSMIRDCNERVRIKWDHELYMTIARIGDEKEYVGIDWVRWWYQRNLIIYSNLAKITTEPSDRTLLIIGSAHVYLISQFLEESGVFKLEKAADYL